MKNKNKTIKIKKWIIWIILWIKYQKIYLYENVRVSLDW